jgi:hypothetical protein
MREFTFGERNQQERAIYEASLVVVNDPKFSDDLFTMKWPPKTKVRDLISSNTFVVADGELDTHGRISREQSETTTQSPRPRVESAAPQSHPDGKSTVRAFVIGGAVVVALVVVVAVRRGQR